MIGKGSLPNYVRGACVSTKFKIWRINQSNGDTWTKNGQYISQAGGDT